jgi:hypothetical protein
VSKVSAFTIPRLDCLFYSSDHYPPHFHVKKAGRWEIRVYFLSCTEQELTYKFKFPKNPGKDKGPTGNERRDILEAVIKHRAALLKEWEEKVRTGEGS